MTDEVCAHLNQGDCGHALYGEDGEIWGVCHDTICYDCGEELEEN